VESKIDKARIVELKVGIMVSVGLLLFVITVIMLGGNSIFKSTYFLKVNLANVQGLAPGSVVQLLGISVGNVDDIRLANTNDQNVLEVVMKIDRSFQKQITAGSIAGVRTQGALGDKFIYITPGNPNGEPLKDNSFVVAETKGGLIDTLMESGDGVQKIFKVVDEIYLLFKNINSGGKSAIVMENLASASGQLNKMMRDLHGKNPDDDNVAKSMQHLASILEKVDNGSGTLGAMINDRSIFEGLKRFVGGPQDKFMKSVIRETIHSKEDLHPGK